MTSTIRTTLTGAALEAANYIPTPPLRKSSSRLPSYNR